MPKDQDKLYAGVRPIAEIFMPWLPCVSLPKSTDAQSTLPLSDDRAIAEGSARVAFRDGETAGVLEIVSIDASGACTVHKVAGLALANLAVMATTQLRRGMS